MAASFEITFHAVEINDNGFTYSPLEAPLSSMTRNGYGLKDLQTAVTGMLRYYESQGIEALAFTRVVDGRAPAGYRAWEKTTKLTCRVLKQAA